MSAGFERDRGLPGSVFVLLERDGILIPTREIARQHHLLGMGSEKAEGLPL
jgi:hypothetical protein